MEEDVDGAEPAFETIDILVVAFFYLLMSLFEFVATRIL